MSVGIFVCCEANDHRHDFKGSRRSVDSQLFDLSVHRDDERRVNFPVLFHIFKFTLHQFVKNL